MTRHEQAIERAREADPKSGGYARRRDNAWPAVVALMEAVREREGCCADMAESGCVVCEAMGTLATALGVPE